MSLRVATVTPADTSALATKMSTICRASFADVQLGIHHHLSLELQKLGADLIVPQVGRDRRLVGLGKPAAL